MWSWISNLSLNALCARLFKELVWYRTKITYVTKKLQYKVTLFFLVPMVMWTGRTKVLLPILSLYIQTDLVWKSFVFNIVLLLTLWFHDYAHLIEYEIDDSHLHKTISKSEILNVKFLIWSVIRCKTLTSFFLLFPSLSSLFSHPPLFNSSM